METWKKYMIWAIVVGVLGVLLLLVGIVLPIYINSALRDGIHDQVVITNKNSAGYSSWQNTNQTSVPQIYKSYNFWNITNPDEYLAGTAKANVSSMGPYSFKEFKTRFNITWNEDKSAMTFKTWERYVFDPETSCKGCSLDDNVTTINLPYLGVKGTLNQMLGDTFYAYLAFDAISSYAGQKIVYTKTAGELIGGYNDDFLVMMANLTKNANMTTVFGLEVHPASMEAAETDPTVTFTTYATGADNVNNVFQETMFQNTNNMNCWATAEANTVTGSEGDQFRPFSSQADNMTTFVENLYRHANLVSNATMEVFGITLNQYVIADAEYLNSTANPANAAYYSFGPNGLMNISKCMAVNQGSPVPMFVSLPLFLNADPSLWEGVTGWDRPDPALHNTVLNIEPISGVTMDAHKRLQLNAYVQADEFGLINPNLGAAYIPIAWIAEEGQISEDLATQFKSQVYGAQKISTWARWVGLSVGAVLIVLTIFLSVRSYRLKHASIFPDPGDDKSNLLINSHEDEAIAEPVVSTTASQL